MAFHNLLPCLLFICVVARISVTNATLPIHSFACSSHIQTCKASLYHINNGSIPRQQIASYYSVNSSQIKPILHGSQQDYLITVPCSCQEINGTKGYFYDITYAVQPNDSFYDVSTHIYSGQVWSVGDEQKFFQAGVLLPMPLVCGCVRNESEIVVTYTVQEQDTLSCIANLLSAQVSDIISLNKILQQNPYNIEVGWVLYVPMHKNM